MVSASSERTSASASIDDCIISRRVISENAAQVLWMLWPTNVTHHCHLEMLKCALYATIGAMTTLKYTDTFNRWMAGLKDRQAKARITVRVGRLRQGNAGDFKSVGERVFELRIHHGPGYRVYFTQRGNALILLLCGGDKSTQQADIKQAQQMAQNWTDDDENH